MKIVLVYNPRSGTAPAIHDLRQYFKQAGIAIGVEIKIEAGFEKKLKRHLRLKQIVAVIGGDGTISSVVNVMQDTAAILAPLPGGTLNHFTKDAGIDQNIEQAIAKLAGASPRTVDYALVNDQVFVNNSSIGLYPSSLQTRAYIESRLGKWPAAILGGLRAWIKYRSYQVTVAGEQITTPFIFVGNNDYRIEHMADGGRKYLNKGMLSVYTIHARNRWEFIRLIVRALNGRLQDIPEIQAWKTTAITIHSNHTKLRVAYDGELAKLPTPLEYKIVPGGLKIIGNS